MGKARLPRGPRERNRQFDEFWRDPEERVSERLMDSAIEHDTERLSRRVGISRRRMNEQREDRCWRSNWLRNLILTIVALRDIGADEERYLQIVRAIADAADCDVVPRVEASERPQLAEVNTLVARTLRHAGQMTTSVIDALEDNMLTRSEALAIDRESDRLIEDAHQIKKLAASCSRTPTRIASA